MENFNGRGVVIMKIIKFIFGGKDSVRRKVIYTMAETMSALIIVANTVWEIDWKAVIGATLLSGLITLLAHIKDIKIKE